MHYFQGSREDRPPPPPPCADARLLVENPFVEHDNSSNTTAGRKKRPSPTLGRFYFYLKYDTFITGIFYINFGLMILVYFFDFVTDKN